MACPRLLSDDGGSVHGLGSWPTVGFDGGLARIRRLHGGTKVWRRAEPLVRFRAKLKGFDCIGYLDNNQENSNWIFL